MLGSPHEGTLFENILPELYSGRCLQSLNDISNRLTSTAQHRDLMTEVIASIDTQSIADLSGYWLCVVGLAAKFVVRVDLFMGIRYLTAQQVQPSLLEAHLEKLSRELERQFSEISERILSEYFCEIEHTN